MLSFALLWPLPSVTVFATIAIPLLIAIFATITDEMAESGADRFRGNQTFRRACVNVQWSVAAFYFAISRGALYPNASESIRTLSSILMIGSLILGLLGTVFVRRYPSMAYAFGCASLAVVLWVGTTV